jgi:hypothetical protein
MDAATRELVRVRASGRCEYCRLSHEFDALPFQIDHILPRKHGGGDTLDNLALSCLNCNAYKGPNLTGIDPHDGVIVAIFHPRNSEWTEHFRWDGPRIVARTAIGRATIAVLGINRPERIEHRRLLMAAGCSFE